jgi:hypothetical protein
MKGDKNRSNPLRLRSQNTYCSTKVIKIFQIMGDMRSDDVKILVLPVHRHGMNIRSHLLLAKQTKSLFETKPCKFTVDGGRGTMLSMTARPRSGSARSLSPNSAGRWRRKRSGALTAAASTSSSKSPSRSSPRGSASECTCELRRR